MIRSVLNKILSYERIEREFKTNVLADLSGLRKGLEPHGPGGPDTSPSEKKILERVRESFLRAKQEQVRREGSYQATGEWTPIVNNVRSNYLEAVRSEKTENFAELIRHFFRNSGSAGLNTHETYDSAVRLNERGQKEFVLKILRDLEIWKDLTENKDYVPLAGPGAGDPWGYSIGPTLILPNACRHHYSAWRIRHLLRGIQRPLVAEIGGGYGGFAYFLQREVPGSAYVDFDLPEILMIAQYYLLSACPDKRILLYGESADPLSAESIANHDLILLPNFSISDLADRSVDVFFNTNGLSEMNEMTVNEYFRHINRATKKYFYHVNSDVPIVIGGGHREIPASRFPVAADFKLLAKHHSPFGGSGGRDKEFLYERQG